MIIKRTLFYLFLFANVASLRSQDALNVDLFALVNRGDVRYSGTWAYIAPDGTEYALIGAKTGTAVYPIDDAANVVELGFVPGPETNWREITVIGQHAFVVTDVQGTGHGMQVIDLSYLPDSLHLVTNYTATFTTAHIIQKAIDNDAPYVYVMGTSTTNGVHVLDVSDPVNPQEIGLYDPGYYIHDAHIRGNRLYAAAFYEFEMDIVDISDKTNPVLIGKITYDGKNTHSSSSTEDEKYLIMADEQDGLPGRVFNVEDPDNPVEVAQYSANLQSLVHNPYVIGDFCIISHNTEDMRILDIADPELPVEVGFYDTFTGASGGFSGLWSACPYFPSGKIIGGDRHNGLYVWTFNGTQAARIYGIVTDSLTGEPLASTDIFLPEIPTSISAGFSGKFKYGMQEGTYTLEASQTGYLPKTIELDLAQGDSIWVEVQLVPEVFSPSNEVAQEGLAIQIFPNPSKGTFFLDAKTLPLAFQLILADANGRTVFSENISGKSSVEVHTGLPSGSYFVKILDENGGLLGSTKIVVQ